MKKFEIKWDVNSCQINARNIIQAISIWQDNFGQITDLITSIKLIK